MKPTKQPAVRWPTTSIIRTFQRSGRKSLLLTGSKGSGKSTLVDALTAGQSLPGVRSYVRRGADGLPVCVLLAERLGPSRCVIGRRQGGAMTADRGALDGVGAEMLLRACAHPSGWAVVDEIGFLEEESAVYRAALLRLFDEKRVLAALRKDELPFLRTLCQRDDCLLLDLDEGWEEP